MKKFWSALLLALSGTAAFGADAELKLAWMFTDHAVFQQGIYLPVWGHAAPGATITAEFNGNRVVTTAAASGDFMLRLAPQKAGGPYTLIVSTDGGKSVTIEDVMVGEVWLASGQSNMEYQLQSDWSSSRNDPEELRRNLVNYKQLHEYLDNTTPQNTIRGLRIPLRTTLCEESKINAKWEVMDAAHAGTLSAVGAWFGRYVQEKTGVTVGVIACSWGGSLAESWTSRSGLLSNPATAPLVAERNEWAAQKKVQTMPERQYRENFLKEHHLADPGNQGLEKGWAKTDFDDGGWKTMTIPGSWVQQKIMGNGALWVRREVTIPEAWIGKDLQLDLGPVDKHDVTYVNGTEVGRTGKNFDDQYWNVHRRYAVPAKLVTSTRLVVAIRAFSHYQDGSIHGGENEYSLSCGAESIPLAGVWRAMPEVDLGHPEYRLPASLQPVFNRPACLFESMLRPIIPYGIRGVIWYQGESNADVVSSKAYRATLGTMIRDWRYRWEEGDFPFIEVELANYRKPKSYSDTDQWSYLRESQRLVCGDLPNVYMASAIDLGEAGDIHPQNKKEVGRRLALVARKMVYGETDLVCSGPVLEQAIPENGALRLAFANAEGMYFKGGVPKGFYVAGEDKVFVPADTVKIEGNTLLVSAKSVASPVAVRYAWSDNPDGNLYNGGDLPAGSFRSDKW